MRKLYLSDLKYGKFSSERLPWLVSRRTNQASLAKLASNRLPLVLKIFRSHGEQACSARHPGNSVAVLDRNVNADMFQQRALGDGDDSEQEPEGRGHGHLRRC